MLIDRRRWIRLLFGRELHFDSLVVLWDEMFMQDEPLANLEFVCVAMILAIRWACESHGLSHHLWIPSS